MKEKKWYVFESKNDDGRLFVIIVYEATNSDAWIAMIKKASKVNCVLDESKLISVSDELITPVEGE